MIVGILLIKIVIKNAIYANTKNNFVGLPFSFLAVLIAI